MKLRTLLTSLFIALALSAGAQVTRTTGVTDQPVGYNPNLHIYLCFGQSNMEGSAPAEAVDMESVNSRFLMYSAVDMPKRGRERGKWYVAYPPLCGQDYGLSPADYFGRTMVQRLPDSITVAVINVAIGGTSIDLFDEDKADAYLPTTPDWLQHKCLPYDNKPYRRLMECAKDARRYGTIKGILMHQGCSDCGQQSWPARVDTVYTRMLRELNLCASDVPLIVGEVMTQEAGGCCYQHNAIIDRIGETIPTAHVVKSDGCPGQNDKYHFTAEGYRELGRRYAEVMLRLLK